MSADGEDATVATAAESAAPSTPKRPDLGAEKAPPKEEEEEEPTDGLFPFTTSREEYFDQRTWWMVDLSCVADDAPNQGATPLVARCMRVHMWDEDHCRRVLTGYKQFLAIKKEKKDWYSKELTPCPDVEKMWKEHICDMGNYWHDCQLLCGHVVTYNPDEAADENAKAHHLKNTAMALKAKFGARFDEDLWTSIGSPKGGWMARQSVKKVTKAV
eukprot:CAMPEP_0172444912 /NCGR_PEP_ID=MMETSP1065-20121228/4924_1 /TAXON_ID=265537 /ORGANISM="Amphiprora paludosa, Strain CCMP125" /LENGTH=214 /DNA_ID=CAMNT_0013195673 /DNA_START=97 /DNA_END=741 /DNA_ORIENTATION=+